MTEFTLEELKKYDGLDGRRAYIAFSGMVYDVTDSFLWKGGRHQAMHSAGCDLTAALGRAPHGASLLARVPAVGKLSAERIN